MSENETKAMEGGALLPTTVMGGNMALYLDAHKMAQLWKVADVLAKSDIIPKNFQGKAGNCFIAMKMAGQMGIDEIFLMQNISVVNGKPGLDAKLVTALVNTSGLLTEDLEYEIVGTDPAWNTVDKKPVDPSYKVRAFGVFKKTGKTKYGPWITWAMVMGEGWVQKDGSKWKTMPEVMFQYRAASYFINQHCSSLKFGMMTTDEAHDITEINPRPSATSKASSILSAFDDPVEKFVDEVSKIAGLPTESGEPGAGEVEISAEEKEAARLAEEKATTEIPKITPAQNKALRVLLTQQKVDPDKFKAHFGIASSLDLSADKMQEAIDWVNLVALKTEEDNGALLQEIFALIAQLAELKFELPDDVINDLTGGKVGVQIDLQDRPTVFLNDIKEILLTELAKEA